MKKNYSLFYLTMLCCQLFLAGMIGGFEFGFFSVKYISWGIFYLSTILIAMFYINENNKFVNEDKQVQEENNGRE